MYQFRTYLTEGAAPGKNLHLEHIEDRILDIGVQGGRDSINFLQALRDMLAGHAKTRVDITVKWDGAPAIFAGIDPSDGKFFVSTKGVFNKNPKLVKTPADVQSFSTGLQPKLKLALKYLEPLGIKGVIQGDMMFTPDDLKTTTIDGQEYLTFQPNTIVYAIPADSALAKQIKAAKLGVVWHTTYSGGETLADMTASFGANISNLKKSRNVWMDDASYRDVSGKLLFTEKETAEITRHLSRAGKVFQKIDSRSLSRFLEGQQALGGSAAGSGFKTYNNSLVRQGKRTPDPRTHARGYVAYFQAWWKERQINKVKTPAAQKQKERMMKEHLRIIRQTEQTIRQITEFQGHILEAKAILLRKLDTGARRLARTFIRTENGYQVTSDEGYVVVDRLKGNAVKLVDRLEFSTNNFNALKNWDK